MGNLHNKNIILNINSNRNSKQNKGSKRRILAWMLSIVMLMTLIPEAAFAAAVQQDTAVLGQDTMDTDIQTEGTSDLDTSLSGESNQIVNQELPQEETPVLEESTPNTEDQADLNNEASNNEASNDGITENAQNSTENNIEETQDKTQEEPVKVLEPVIYWNAVNGDDTQDGQSAQSAVVTAAAVAARAEEIRAQSVTTNPENEETEITVYITDTVEVVEDTALTVSNVRFLFVSAAERAEGTSFFHVTKGTLSLDNAVLGTEENKTNHDTLIEIQGGSIYLGEKAEILGVLSLKDETDAKTDLPVIILDNKMEEGKVFEISWNPADALGSRVLASWAENENIENKNMVPYFNVTETQQDKLQLRMDESETVLWIEKTEKIEENTAESTMENLLPEKESEAANTLKLGEARESNVFYWNPNPNGHTSVDGQIDIPGGDDMNTGKDKDHPFRSWDKVLTEIGTGNATVYVLDTINLDTFHSDGTVNSGTASKTIDWNGEGRITLCQLDGAEVPIFTVTPDSSLTLQNITLQGNKSLIQVEMGDATNKIKNGTLTLNAGTRLANSLGDPGFFTHDLDAANASQDILEPVYVNIPLAELQTTGGFQVYYGGIADNQAYLYQDVIFLSDGNGASDVDAANYTTVIKTHDSNDGWSLQQDSEYTDSGQMSGNKNHMELYRPYAYSGIFINGTDKGNDSYFGGNCNWPVKTMARAKAILAEQIKENMTQGTGHGISAVNCMIYLCDTVTVSDQQVWDFNLASIKKSEVETGGSATENYFTEEEIAKLPNYQNNLKLIPCSKDNSDTGLHQAAPTTMVSVANGGELTITNLTIAYHKAQAGDFKMIQMVVGSKCTLGNGALLTNIQTPSDNTYDGYGVYLDGSGNEETCFTLDGGKIEKTGQAILARQVSLTAPRDMFQVILKGGEISNNRQRNSTPLKVGGSINLYQATLTISEDNPNVPMVIKNNYSRNSNWQSYGGGIYARYCTIRMTGGSIENNSLYSSTSSGQAAVYYSPSLGGGVYLLDSTMDMTGGSITGNNASYGRGGGVYVGGGATLSIGGDATISDNKVSIKGRAGYVYGGGGIWCEYGATLNMTGGSVSNNWVYAGSSYAPYAMGGGIGVSGADVQNINNILRAPTINITGGKITGNGIYVENQLPAFSGCGGGIAFAAMESADNTVTIKNAEISGNKAAYGGGICNVSATNVRVESTVVSENKAQWGGGIASVHGLTGNWSTRVLPSTYLTNVTVKNNEASVQGGGVYTVYGSLEMDGDRGSIVDNQVTDATGNGRGGGVYSGYVGYSQGFRMAGGTVSGNGLDGGSNMGTQIYNKGTLYLLGGQVGNTSETSIEEDYGIFLDLEQGNAVSKIYVDMNEFLLVDSYKWYLNTVVSKLHLWKPVINPDLNQAPLYMDKSAFSVGSVLVTPAKVGAETVSTTICGTTYEAESYTTEQNTTYVPIFDNTPDNLPEKTVVAGFKTDIVLAGLGVYLNGEDGDDNRDGTTPNTAVKTFAKAKEKLRQYVAVANDAGNTAYTDSYDPYIYVCGKVTVDSTTAAADDLNWSLDENDTQYIVGHNNNRAQVKRFASYIGQMLYIEGQTVSFEKITVEGGFGPTDTSQPVQEMISVGSGGTLIMKENAVVTNSAAGGIYIRGGKLQMESTACLTNHRKNAVQITESGTLKMTGDSYIRNPMLSTYGTLSAASENSCVVIWKEQVAGDISVELDGNAHIGAEDDENNRTSRNGIFYQSTNAGTVLPTSEGASAPIEVSLAGFSSISHVANGIMSFNGFGCRTTLSGNSKIENYRDAAYSTDTSASAAYGNEALYMKDNALLINSADTSNVGIKCLQWSYDKKIKIGLSDKAAITAVDGASQGDSYGIQLKQQIRSASSALGSLELTMDGESKIEKQATGIGTNYNSGTGSMVNSSAYILTVQMGETAAIADNGYGMDLGGEKLTMTMEGSSSIRNNRLEGLIYGCAEATNDSGKSSLTLSGSSHISGNGRDGVYVRGNRIYLSYVRTVNLQTTLKDNSSICDNQGRGIEFGANSSLTMKTTADGTPKITGNQAQNCTVSHPAGTSEEQLGSQIFADGSLTMDGAAVVGEEIYLNNAAYPITLTSVIPEENSFVLGCSDNFIGQTAVKSYDDSVFMAKTYLSRYTKSKKDHFPAGKNLVEQPDYVDDAGISQEGTTIIVEGSNDVYIAGTHLLGKTVAEPGLAVGDDSNNGGSAGAPVRTFSQAVKLLKTRKPGANIVVCNYPVTVENCTEDKDLIWQFDAGGSFTNDKGDTWNPKVIRYEQYTGTLFELTYRSRKKEELTFKNITIDGGNIPVESRSTYLAASSTVAQPAIFCVYGGSGTNRAILNIGENTVLENHRIEGEDVSGAVYISYGTLNMEDAVVRNNTITRPKDAAITLVINGGFLYSYYSSVNLIDTLIEKNTTLYESTGVYAQIQGGLIYSYGGTMTLSGENCILSENSVTIDTGSGYDGHIQGGLVYSYGTLLKLQSGAKIIDNNIGIDSKYVGNSASADINGGIIYSYNEDLELTETDITGNVIGKESISDTSYRVNIKGGILSKYGGQVLEIKDTVITDNKIQASYYIQGGVLRNERVDLNLNGTKIEENKVCSKVSWVYGSALYLHMTGGTSGSLGANTSISKNEGRANGSIFGTIYTINAGETVVNGASIVGNTLSTDAGTCYGPAIYDTTSSTGKVTVVAGTISGNQNLKADGTSKGEAGQYKAGIYVNASAHFGIQGGSGNIPDGIYLSSTAAPLILRGSIYQHNRKYPVYLNTGTGSSSARFKKGSVVVTPDNDHVLDAAPYLQYFSVSTPGLSLEKDAPNLVLKSILFLDSDTGVDTNDGLLPTTALKSFNRVKQIIAANGGDYVVYISGPVRFVDGQDSATDPWTLPSSLKSWLCRYTGFPVSGQTYPAYDGDLFEVENGKTITLGEMNVYGRRDIDASTEAAGSMIYVAEGGNLTLDSPNLLLSRNNAAKVVGGGILRNDGTTEIKSGTLQEGTATLGTAIYQNGSLKLSGSPLISGSVYLAGVGTDDSTSHYVEVSDDYVPAGTSKKLSLEIQNAFDKRKVVEHSSGNEPDATQTSYYQLPSQVLAAYRVDKRPSEQHVLELQEQGLVYIDGVSGNDSNSGSTPRDAVKTFRGAYKKLENSTGGLILVVDTVSITDTVAGESAADIADTIILRNVVAGSGASQVYSSVYEVQNSTGVVQESITVNGSVGIRRYSKPSAYTASDSHWNGYDVPGFTGTLLDVKSTGNLTISNIQLDGHRNEVIGGEKQAAPGVEAIAPLITVQDGGKVFLEKGATLTGNNNVSDTVFGGGVSLKDANAELHVNSSTIQQCSAKRGGSVYDNGALKFRGWPDIDGEIYLCGQGTETAQDTSRYIEILEHGVHPANLQLPWQIMVEDAYIHRPVAEYLPGAVPTTEEQSHYSLDDATKAMYKLGNRAIDENILELQYIPRVYVDGVRGSDAYSGMVPNESVQTLKHAYELLKAYGGGTLVVVGTVTITSNIAYMTGTTYSDNTTGSVIEVKGRPVDVERYVIPTYYNSAPAYINPGDHRGTLFAVGNGGELTIENMVIDGHKNAATGNEQTAAPGLAAAAPLLQVLEGGRLYLNEGAVLQNNSNVHTDARIEGGAVSNSGTFEFHDAKLIGNENKDSYGDGIWQNGNFTIVDGAEGLKEQSIYLTSVKDGEKWSMDHVISLDVPLREATDVLHTLKVDMDHAVRGRNVAQYTFDIDGDYEAPQYTLGNTVDENVYFLVQSQEAGEPNTLELQNWEEIMASVPTEIYLVAVQEPSDSDADHDKIRRERLQSPIYELESKSAGKVKVDIVDFKDTSVEAGITHTISLVGASADADTADELYLAIKGESSVAGNPFSGVTEHALVPGTISLSANIPMGTLDTANPIGTFSFTGTAADAFFDKYKDKNYDSNLADIETYLRDNARAKYRLTYRIMPVD